MNYKKIIIVTVAIFLIVTLSVSYVHAQTLSFSSYNSTITFGFSNQTTPVSPHRLSEIAPAKVTLAAIVNASDLPTQPQTYSLNTTVIPFNTIDPLAFAAIKKQLDSGNYPKNLLPVVPNTPISNSSTFLVPITETSVQLIKGLHPSVASILPGGMIGLNQTQSGNEIPPDVQVAVGPNHVMEMVNLQEKIWDKQGNQLTSGNLSAFFSSGKDGISDPKVFYDFQSQRWFSSIVDFSKNMTKIAVSTTNVPTGTWTIYNVMLNACPDQPKIAVNNDKFVVAAGMYTNNCNFGNFVNSQFVVIDKNQMISGNNNPNVQTFSDSGVISIAPAKSLSSTSTLYMAASNCVTNPCDSRMLNGTTSIVLYSITGLAGSVSVNTVNIAIGNSVIPPGAPAPQTFLITDDNKIQDASWYNGKLWFSINDACIPSGDNTYRSCIHLGQVDTSSKTLSKEIRVGTTNLYYFYPALTIDNTGSLDLIFGGSSSTIQPELLITGQTPYDPVNTVEPIQTLVSSTNSTEPKPYRYGDYFGAGIDPSKSLIAWVSGEYLTLPNHSGKASVPWSTFIGKMTLYCVTPTSSGDWTISSSCILGNSFNATADIFVSNNSVLTIPSGVKLGVNFSFHKLFINPGSGVLIQSGGKISSD